MLNVIMADLTEINDRSVHVMLQTEIWHKIES